MINESVWDERFRSVEQLRKMGAHIDVEGHIAIVEGVEKLSGAVLDLGGVFNLARVFVNGQDMGQVWKEPFRIDISDAIRVGENSLEVEVTNSWVNRMIGDAQPGVTEPFTYVTVHHYDADSPLRASGLAGPVVLELTE